MNANPLPATAIGGAEQTIVENHFGTVTNKRVIYYRSRGRFGGGSREDIPLQHVTSVRLDISRSSVLGLLCLLIAFGTLALPDGAGVIGLFLLVLGVFLLWGSPAVVVNTAGRDLNAAVGWPWAREEAQAFVEALRGQLFRT